MQHPALVGAYTSTGGSVCCEGDYLIDVSTPEAKTLKGFEIDQKTSLVGGYATFDKVTRKTFLGDPIVTTFRYHLGSGEQPDAISFATQYNKKPITSADLSASEVLSNPRLRPPLLKVVGGFMFAHYRDMFAVSGAPVKIVDDEYIVGEGCMAHNCPFSFGIFVIDYKNERAWSVICEDNKANSFGALGPTDTVPRSEISRWQQGAAASGDACDPPTTNRPVSTQSAPMPPPPVAAPLPRGGDCEEDTLSTVSDDGDILIMGSGHTYKVLGGDTVDSALWLPPSDVLICGDSIINKDENGEKVEAQLLK